MADVAKSIPTRLPKPIQNFDLRRLIGQDDLCYLMYILSLGDDDRLKCVVGHYESKQDNKDGFPLLVKQQGCGLGQILFGSPSSLAGWLNTTPFT